MSAPWALLSLAFAALPVACTTSTGQVACDCADPTLTLNVPPDVAAEATVALSGPACAGVTPVCATMQTGCSVYRFRAAAAGTCNVEVDFATGQVFKNEVTILAPSGCCPGYYASPLSAANIDVPEPTDGGAG